MARFIDADALYKKLYPLDLVDKRLYTINAKAVADAIAKTPTADVVEVVRCMDCRFASIDTEGSYYVICLNPDAPWSRYKDEFSLPPNHYCSYGERKE